MFTSSILLAAGGAVRMGVDKLLLPYKGRRVIDWAMSPFVDSQLIDEVIVVVHPDSRLSVEAPKCRMVANVDHKEGMGASLRTGVADASDAADALVVSLADLPELTVGVVDILIRVFHHSTKKILVPMYGQRAGHPVVFSSACREDLMRLGGDLGARRMIRDQPNIVEHFWTRHRGVVYDVDASEDIQLRRMAFADRGVFRDVVALFESAGIYFETEVSTGPAGDERAVIAYYPFDEDKVLAFCRGDDESDSPCMRKS